MAQVLALEAPMSDCLCADLEDLENVDGRRRSSGLFQPLTLNMEKIWSFFETMDSALSVEAKANNRIGSTTVWKRVSANFNTLHY